jgi:hypothetical protein
MAIVSAVYVCIFIQTGPARFADRIVSSAFSILPLWLADGSAIIKTRVLILML